MLNRLLGPVLEAGKKQLEPLVKKVGTIAAKRGAQIVGSVVLAAIISSILTANYMSKVHKDLSKKHDEDTAKRLSREFEQKLESEKKKWKEQNIRDKAILREKIRKLCEEFGIDPSVVLK